MISWTDGRECAYAASASASGACELFNEVKCGRSAALAAVAVEGVAGAVALRGEVVLVDARLVAADDSVVPEDAQVVGGDDTVKPPPDTDVG